MGDVAGIGPEIIVRAWPELVADCKPTVIGDQSWLERAVQLVASPARIQVVQQAADGEASRDVIPFISGSQQDLRSVKASDVSAAAGKAAYDFLCRAIDMAMAGDADGIVTAPLHKEGLRAAGLPYPGHTEILAERTGATRFAMLLHCSGLTVAHVTLHMALRDVFASLSTQAVFDKIILLDDMLDRLHGRRCRIGVAALNPHASDGGLFGDEETRLIRPAVEQAVARGIDVSGPWPADTLFFRARQGEFQGIVAMYHDQGHIAIKVLGPHRAVNISAGLPIVRTSVAHGTAYDIAGKGVADATGLVEAARVAALLAAAPSPTTGRALPGRVVRGRLR